MSDDGGKHEHPHGGEEKGCDGKEEINCIHKWNFQLRYFAGLLVASAAGAGCVAAAGFFSHKPGGT